MVLLSKQHNFSCSLILALTRFDREVLSVTPRRSPISLWEYPSITYKLKTGSVKDFPGTKSIAKDAVLEMDVDILYPAALENAISLKNADKIKARIVCELANGPTTPEADLILHKKGIHVIPDILASAGGVTVSYFEMVQDNYSFFWDEETVHRRLDAKLTNAYHTVEQAIRERKVHPRLAAMVVAVARVAESCKLRGWV